MSQRDRDLAAVELAEVALPSSWPHPTTPASALEMNWLRLTPSWSAARASSP
jgi:hypothetical protein